MVEKPISGDEEQRRAQTRAAREQSGLAPEPDTAEEETPKEPARGRSARDREQRGRDAAATNGGSR